MIFDLNHIEDEIEESRYIYENDISHELWSVSMQLLLKYSIRIYENSNIVIEEPEINPSENSTIDIRWRSFDNNLYLNIKYDQIINDYVCSYIGESYISENYTSKLCNPLDIDSNLELWISKFKL